MARKIKKTKKIKLKKVSKSVQKAKLKKLAKISKPSFLEGPIKKIKIGVIGVGGGGGNIVSELAQRIKKTSFFIANTDSKALKNLPRNVIPFQFGQNVTFGLGTGMDFELAKEAAKKEREKIKKILERQDLIIFIATLGGGVGSGASPVFTRISKRLGNLNFGIFTLPFKFEGEKKIEIAKDSLEKLRPNLNAILVFPNDGIFKFIDKRTPLKEALSVINKNLAESLEDLIEIIYLPGLINLDFADLRTILEGRGKLAYLNTIKISESTKIEEEIKKLIFSSLYPYTIEGAKGVLFNISGRDLSLGQIAQISGKIFELVGKEAKIIFGVSKSKKLEKEIKITLLATGCRPWIFQRRIKEIKKSVGGEKKIIPIEKKEEIFPEKKLESQAASLKVKIRRNALEVKKTAQKEEEEILAKEKIFEVPTFLRKGKKF